MVTAAPVVNPATTGDAINSIKNPKEERLLINLCLGRRVEHADFHIIANDQDPLLFKRAIK